MSTEAEIRQAVTREIADKLVEHLSYRKSDVKGAFQRDVESCLRFLRLPEADIALGVFALVTNLLSEVEHLEGALARRARSGETGLRPALRVVDSIEWIQRHLADESSLVGVNREDTLGVISGFLGKYRVDGSPEHLGSMVVALMHLATLQRVSLGRQVVQAATKVSTQRFTTDPREASFRDMVIDETMRLDNAVRSYEKLKRDHEELLELVRAKRDGDFWVWMDDPEEDDIDSLTCPILVRPEIVKRWLEAERRANGAE